MTAAAPFSSHQRAMRELPSGLVTFVFTDIEGSTILLNQLGGEDYGEALVRHREIIGAAAESRGGHVVSTPGDAMFLAFSDPLGAVVAMRDAFIGLAAEPWPQDVALRVRAGAHAGEAVPRGGDYVAIAVHQAARVGAAAHGGQILMSSSVASVAGALPAGIALRDLGKFVLRDFPLPEPLFQLHSPELESDFPRPRTAEVVRGNLPVVRTSFVGRIPELAFLRTEIRDKRLITLVGPGGVGKSRLSAELASGLVDSFPDGVWLVELAPIVDETGCVPAVAEVLGVPLSSEGNDLHALVEGVAGRRMLVVLDNCEHVLSEAAAVADSLSVTPDVSVLATSRSPLGVPGETVHRVTSLGVGDATDLFIDRAGAAGATDLDRGVVQNLVLQLDGIPLALELAAACTRSIGVNELAARLDDRFRLLRSESGASIAQHRTLKALVDWSHDLLDDDERVLFRRLAVFSGGCTLESAERVCSGELLAEEDVAFHLTGLVDKSLVQMLPGVAGESRYTMLETLRMYAAGRLHEAEEETDAHRRHVRAMVAFAEKAGVGMRGPEFRRWYQRCDEEASNLVSALKWPLTDATSRAGRLDLVSKIGAYWTTSEKGIAILPVWKAVLEDTEDLDPAEVLAARISLASRLSGSAPPAGHVGLLDELMAEAAKTAPSFSHVCVQALHSWAIASLGDHETAEAEIESAVSEASVLGDSFLMPFALVYSSNVYARINKPALSIERAARAAEIAIENGHLRLAILAESGVGWGYLALGDPRASEGPSRRALEAALEAGYAGAGATARLNLGHADRLQGRFAEAAINYAEAYTLGLLTGDKPVLAESIEGLMTLCAAADLPADGARLLGAAEFVRADGYPVEPVLLPAYDAAVETFTSSLGEAELRSMRTQGAGLPAEKIQALVQQTAAALQGERVQD